MHFFLPNYQCLSVAARKKICMIARKKRGMTARKKTAQNKIIECQRWRSESSAE
jgi:hypothetical protein